MHFERAIAVWVARWAELVEAGQRDGSIRSELDSGEIAAELHTLVNGLRLAALLQTNQRIDSRGRVRVPHIALLDALEARQR